MLIFYKVEKSRHDQFITIWKLFFSQFSCLCLLHTRFKSKRNYKVDKKKYIYFLTFTKSLQQRASFAPTLPLASPPRRALLSRLAPASGPVGVHRAPPLRQRTHDASEDPGGSLLRLLPRGNLHGVAAHQETLEHRPRETGVHLRQPLASNCKYGRLGAGEGGLVGGRGLVGGARGSSAWPRGR